QKRPTGYLGSVLIGLGFAAGWTPCTGPILAGVMALGVANPSMGLFYMSFYVLGFSIPFLIMTFFIDKMKFLMKHGNRFMKFGGILIIVFIMSFFIYKIKILKKIWKCFMKFGCILMIFIGIFFYFDWMRINNAFLIPLFGGFNGF